MLIGKFAAILTMSANKFIKGMSLAAKSTKTMASTAVKLTAKIAKLGAALTGFGAAATAAAAAAIANLTKRGIDSVDALGNVAARLGITAEALSVLHFAAEQTGVTIETMNMALQRMTRRISEAGQGSGEAKDALKELGLDARNLAALAPDKQFRAITKAMEGVANQGDKVRLSMRLYDSEGVSLVQTMAAGTAGLDDFASRAKNMGLTVTEEMVAKVRAAKSAIDELGAVSTGLSNILATELSPFVQVTAQRFIDWIKAGGGLRAKVIPAIRSVAVGIAKVSSVVDLLTAGWRMMRFSLESSLAGITMLLADGARAVEDFLNLIPGVDVGHQVSAALNTMVEDFGHNASEELRKAGEAFDRFASGDRANRVGAWFDQITSEADKAARDAVRDRPESAGPLSTFAPDRTTTQKTDRALQRMKREAESIINATRTPLEQLAAEREKLNQLLRAGLIDQETFQRSMIASAKTAGVIDKKSGQLSQVVRGRFTVGGPSRKSPQVKEQEKTNTWLARIAAVLDKGVPARAA
jgi:hypothetical protein